MALPTLFLGACLYYLIFSLLADQIALPDVIARDIFPVVERINIILAISLPLLFVCVLGWAFFLSFKFLAPLERLEEDLKKIDEGDYSVRLEIRGDHDLKPVADIINHLVGKLEENKGKR
ncbi:MAG: methyl-accepting chemotaxis protein [Candidatus Omnitrophica bacterium]|nr:methyl-accepting chemotaxis protein [Candidatus Omnitrophota bacterium]